MAAPKQSSGVLTPCLHCRLAPVLPTALCLGCCSCFGAAHRHRAITGRDTGAAHGYGAAQGAAHEDGAALCPLQTSLVLGVSACRLSLVLPLSALHTSL